MFFVSGEYHHFYMIIQLVRNRANVLTYMQLDKYTVVNIIVYKFVKEKIYIRSRRCLYVK